MESEIEMTGCKITVKIKNEKINKGGKLLKKSDLRGNKRYDG